MTPSNFEIIEKISESLTTKVYKARQPSLDRIVLLKTLHKNLVGDAGLLKRFEREAKACAMLRSEHIVQVYHLDEYDGAPAIVIEYVEGTALDELLAKHPKQSEEFALTVAQGVLKALVVAHGAGVV
ncbi:MAG TPA: serine/threonine protein kinase, partial [Bacteroidetes bacterium]|nr:serine/threonine protein kinase [Bacteroidota bacterium]